MAECTLAADCGEGYISDRTRWRARLRRATPRAEWQGRFSAPATPSPSGSGHGARRPRPVLCMGRRPDGPRKDGRGGRARYIVWAGAPTARGETGHRKRVAIRDTRGSNTKHPGSTGVSPSSRRDHFDPHRNGTALSFPPSPIFLSPIFLSNAFPLSPPHGIIPVFQRWRSPEGEERSGFPIRWIVLVLRISFSRNLWGRKSAYFLLEIFSRALYHL